MQRLAEAAGVPLPEESAAAPDPAKKSRFEAMLAALEDATRYFEAELRRRKRARMRGPIWPSANCRKRRGASSGWAGRRTAGTACAIIWRRRAMRATSWSKQAC